MFPITTVRIVNDLQLTLENINAVAGVEVLIEDCVVLVLLPAGLNTLQFGHQPGLSIEVGGLKTSNIYFTKDQRFTSQHRTVVDGIMALFLKSLLQGTRTFESLPP